MNESADTEPILLTPAPAPPAAPPSGELVPGHTLKRFLHIVVLLIGAFLVVRTLFVEPFGVTTGSMAATVHGNNRQAPCPRCGYPLCVGSPSSEDRLNPQEDAWCPNCGKKPIDLTVLCEEVPGDRLLVDKSVFTHRKPHRWEVAVFRCPVDDSKPYVKRVAGLPGEAFRMFDGDLYANGELQRKPRGVFREVRVPVFAMAYVPDPEGWTQRWIVEPEPPAGESAVRGGELMLDGSARPILATYRHRNVDTKIDEPITDRLAYNGGVLPVHIHTAHDFQVECEIEVLAGSGVVSLRLFDGADSVKADLPVGPADDTSTEGSFSRDGGDGRPFTGAKLHPGLRHTVEFGFIDRRAFLYVDGVEAAPAFELPPPAAERKGVSRPLQLAAAGAKVVVRNLAIHRDIHYRAEGPNAKCDLGPDEYFMLGDNSANSKDSREWEIPGVPEKDFLGKPFLIHQPLRVKRVGDNGRVQVLDWDRLKPLE